MSYTPTTWANGDTITAEKMNNIEQGIVDASSGGGGGGVTTFSGTVDPDTYAFTLEKTWAECKAIVDAGDLGVCKAPAAGDMLSPIILLLAQYGDDGAGNYVLYMSFSGTAASTLEFTCAAEDAYPVAYLD